MAAPQSRPKRKKKKSAARWIVPLIMLGLGVGIIAAMVFRAPPNKTPLDLERERAAAEAAEAAVNDAAEDTEPPTDDALAANADGADEITSDEAPAASGDTAASTLTGLRARPVSTGQSGADVAPASIGSLDPAVATMKIDFSLAGAGMSRMEMSDQWLTWQAARQAEAHHDAVAANAAEIPPLPAEDQRYMLNSSRPFGSVGGATEIPVLAMFSIEINGEDVPVFNVWSETAPGRFETEIVDENDTVVARARRQFMLGDTGDITLAQTLENLSGRPLEIRWKQYGPSELDADRSKYLDRRRLRFGFQRTDDPAYPHSHVYGDDEGVIERDGLLKDLGKMLDRGEAPTMRIWPDEDPDTASEQALVWYASTNRYFTLAVHPHLAEPIAPGTPLLLGDVVEEIHAVLSRQANGIDTLFTYLVSPARRIAPGAQTDFTMGVYGGPLDRERLKTEEPFRTLNMDELILFLMSTCCAICTFPWLANLLLGFLSLLHDYVVFDWAVAIIILVIIVRTLLHPLVKKGQISMARMSKAMQGMKPEIEKLQKKYADDPKRMQQEQLRLWKEHNVSPAGCLGILPMFLQMPIWVALYAMLYFTYDLRHEPAFYGFFQMFGNWPFLADLSASDHFFGEFAEPFQFFFWNITGINVLPILMGLMFYVQQKYMTPPTTGTMTPEQEQMQKMMRIMLPLMMPLMLYSAPSGLTLYILTSSTIGMMEAKYIRSHIRDIDLKKPEDDAKRAAKKKSKPRGMMARAQARAQEAMEQRQKDKMRGPQKTYKKRRK